MRRQQLKKFPKFCFAGGWNLFGTKFLLLHWWRLMNCPGLEDCEFVNLPSETNATLWSWNDFTRLPFGIETQCFFELLLPYRMLPLPKKLNFRNVHFMRVSSDGSIDAVMSGLCIQLSKVFLWKRSAFVFRPNQQQCPYMPFKTKSQFIIRSGFNWSAFIPFHPRSRLLGEFSISSALYSSPNSSKIAVYISIPPMILQRAEKTQDG